jgi:hypothetical protein
VLLAHHSCPVLSTVDHSVHNIDIAALAYIVMSATAVAAVTERETTLGCDTRHSVYKFVCYVLKTDSTKLLSSDS